MNKPSKNNSSNGDAIRIANFMDSPLVNLNAKGNLNTAPLQYNPRMVADKVLHFTPSPDDTQFNEQFGKYNITIVPLFRSAKRRIWDFPTALMIAFKGIRTGRVNIIRGRLPYFGSLLGCLCGIALGIPRIISLGGDNRLPQQLENRYYFNSQLVSFGMEKLVLLMANKIIVPNNYTADYVGRIIGFKRALRKCVKIPWILHIDKDFEGYSRDFLNDRFGLDRHQKLILIVGHINKYKYSNVLFDVVEKMSTSSEPDLQFVFCGDGNLRGEGEKRFGNKRNVFFIGWQEHEIVFSLIQQACIVVIPMSGFVLLEAACLGRPVITSNIEWHSELVKSEWNGLLVDPRSVDEWMSALQQMAERPELRDLCANNIRESFEQEYEPSRLLDIEIDLYHKILKRGFKTR